MSGRQNDQHKCTSRVEEIPLYFLGRIPEDQDKLNSVTLFHSHCTVGRQRLRNKNKNSPVQFEIGCYVVSVLILRICRLSGGPDD